MRKRKRERTRDRERERCRIFFIGMTGALAPFSYLVLLLTKGINS